MESLQPGRSLKVNLLPVVHFDGFNLVENKHVSCFCQLREADVSPNARFQADGDEDLALGISDANCLRTDR